MATQATSLGESLSTVSFLELRELSCTTDVPCAYRNLPTAIKTRPIKQLTLSDPPYISSTTTTTSSPITTSSSGAQRDTQQPESGLNALSKIVIGATVGSFSLILIIILTIWLLQRRRKGKRQKPVPRDTRRTVPVHKRHQHPQSIRTRATRRQDHRTGTAKTRSRAMRGRP